MKTDVRQQILEILEKYYDPEKMKRDQYDWNDYFPKITDEILTLPLYSKEFVIAFTNWLDKLQPSQRVSVWSKNGEYKGLFTMDNEQLFERFYDAKKKEQ